MIDNNGRVGKIRELASGFTIETTALPPYYMDFIEDAYPYIDNPTWEYTNVAGDVFPLEYEPPDNPPDPDDEEDPDSEENYIMWKRWQDIQRQNVVISNDRWRARRDFLLAVCVNVIDGPCSVDDDSWTDNLEAVRGYKTPSDPGARKVAFLKSMVVTSEEIWHIVQQDSMFLEVTVEGVYLAVAGLGLMWEGRPLTDVIAEKPASMLEHNVMLWETETAEACGIPFDERWYSIPVKTREYMIAGRLGRQWGSGLIDEEAARKAARSMKGMSK